MPLYEQLAEREALKIKILADQPKIMAFIRNSTQMWMMAQFGEESLNRVFYGSGNIASVVARQLARKSCMAAWRKSKEDGDILRLIEPVATVLDHSRRIAQDLQDYLNESTPYDALVQFQTPGFINPLSQKDYSHLRDIVQKRQTDFAIETPSVDPETQKSITYKMIDMAAIDRDKVDIHDHVAHPACMGYGATEHKVQLGLTFDFADAVTGMLTNWHEIGHAAYRQALPYGQFVHGRAMDEAVAFLFEHVIGRSDDFLQFLLDEGLSKAGFDLALLKEHVRHVNRQTLRIETNPLRHVIDISLCEALERAVINESIESEDCASAWFDIISPYTDILPRHYPFYSDVHMMTGIYGDRASYNPGLLASFQLAQSGAVTLDNANDFVANAMAQCKEKRFDQAVQSITGESLSSKPYFKWIDSFYI